MVWKQRFSQKILLRIYTYTVNQGGDCLAKTCRIVFVCLSSFFYSSSQYLLCAEYYHNACNSCLEETSLAQMGHVPYCIQYQGSQLLNINRRHMSLSAKQQCSISHGMFRCSFAVVLISILHFSFFLSTGPISIPFKSIVTVGRIILLGILAVQLSSFSYFLS